MITIGWLYPDLMSTYGDRGNIICLQKRCSWRGISSKIVAIDAHISEAQLASVDIIIGGGSQDIAQEIVMRDLRGKKGTIIKQRIEKGTPALFVCGAPQIMGMYYEPALGKRIEGIGIFDMVTNNPGNDAKRCIGNVSASVVWKNVGAPGHAATTIVGFENHGGRTYLGKNAKPFAKIIKGNGNNGEDGTEGVVYNNAIGCYFHGPLLPRNPVIADYLLSLVVGEELGELKIYFN